MHRLIELASLRPKWFCQDAGGLQAFRARDSERGDVGSAVRLIGIPGLEAQSPQLWHCAILTVAFQDCVHVGAEPRAS
jgi:hypothetical protein